MLPEPFKVKLPEIYQIEASASCDHSCTMCPRAFYHREDKKQMFDINLLRTMISRGDLNGSYFIELQMSGEPLLHPNLATMIDLIKHKGIIVGLSTHGDLFPEQLETCKELDYITVSVDSITNRSGIRKGSKFDNPDKYLEHLLNTAEYFAKKGIPIDFQFIELKGWEKEKTILDNFFKCNWNFIPSHNVHIRSIPDCCILHRTGNRLKPSDDKGLCLNPWLSVSVQSNGNVSSCCFAWGDENTYGNLYEQSLEEIWNGEKIKRLQNNHRKGFSHLPDLCMKCYTRSPVLLHWEIYMNSVVSANKLHRLGQKLNKI